MMRTFEPVIEVHIRISLGAHLRRSEGPEGPQAAPSRRTAGAREWSAAGALDRLEEIKAMLESGEIAWFKEIADFYGVSKMMATKYIKRGEELGLWTREEVDRWIAMGRQRRKDGTLEGPPTHFLGRESA